MGWILPLMVAILMLFCMTLLVLVVALWWETMKLKYMFLEEWNLNPTWPKDVAARFNFEFERVHKRIRKI